MTALVTPNLAAAAMRQLTSQGMEQAERVLLSHQQAECAVYHRFGPGTYFRELHMPRGIIAIGHAQRFEHVNVLLAGRVLMLQDDGSTKELAAPMWFIGKPGRKIGFVLEDVVWQNVYATEERDIEKLEAMFLDKSGTWCDVQQSLLAFEDLVARQDFDAMLHEYGISATTVRMQSVDTSDQVPMPLGSWNIKTGPSRIEGKGIFLTAPANAGELIGPARINGKRTPLGRYTNHSPAPNAKMVLHINGNIDLVALRPILGCHGGEDGEEVTIDYRQALSLSGVTPTGEHV